MVTSRCYACYRTVTYSATKDDVHHCVQCGHKFCFNHGRPFVCTECLGLLDNQKRAQVMVITGQVRNRRGGGIFLFVLGVILAFTSIYGFAWLSIPTVTPITYYPYSSTTTYPNMAFVAAPVIQLLIGLAMLIGGIALASNQGAAAKQLRDLLPPRTPSAGVAASAPGSARVNRAAAGYPPVTGGIGSPPPLRPSPQRMTSRPSWMPSEVPDSLPRAQRSQEPAPQPSLLRTQSTIQQPAKPKVARFCPFCGGSLPEDPRLQFCPNCGAKIE
jgi:hypothetical protein